MLATTFAFVRVHDAVKSAFEEIRNELLPLYANVVDENPEATNERIDQFLQPYSNFVNDGLQRDAFLVCDALTKDIIVNLFVFIFDYSYIISCTYVSLQSVSECR